MGQKRAPKKGPAKIPKKGLPEDLKKGLPKGLIKVLLKRCPFTLVWTWEYRNGSFSSIFFIQFAKKNFITML